MTTATGTTATTSSAVRELPIPPFYDPAKASEYLYDPPQIETLARAEEWKRRFNIPAASVAKTRINLLIIDPQRDFCFPEGTLYVGGRSGRGALEDNDRTAQFIYRNLLPITEIDVTLDTHFPYQIFTPAFWLDAAGNFVQPHTVISVADIRAGTYRPNPAMAKFLCNGNYTWLLEHVEHYCNELEKAGKFQLYIWPYHCQLGKVGHGVVGVIQEAVAFHSFARGNAPHFEVKGGSFYTENYSVMSPEVLQTHDKRTIGQRNTVFIEKLLAADYLIITGQAASHCVNFSIDDLLTGMDPKLTKKVYILKDCTSPVAVPDGKGGFLADFTDAADAAFKKFEDAGMHLVLSTDPIASWPGITLE